jgi:class 3 adenylate cyclase
MTIRRLAAILAADVVGFSKLVGEDEAGTLAALREIRKRIVSPILAEHGGRIFSAELLEGLAPNSGRRGTTKRKGEPGLRKVDVARPSRMATATGLASAPRGLVVERGALALAGANRAMALRPHRSLRSIGHADFAKDVLHMDFYGGFGRFQLCGR